MKQYNSGCCCHPPAHGYPRVYGTLTGTLSNGSLRGYSAYDLAVKQGYVGSLNDWLRSLVGAGIDRITKTSNDENIDNYTIYLTDGTEEKFTVTNGKDGNDGHEVVMLVEDGILKYKLDNETEWLELADLNTIIKTQMEPMVEFVDELPTENIDPAKIYILRENGGGEDG